VGVILSRTQLFRLYRKDKWGFMERYLRAKNPKELLGKNLLGFKCGL
jgi:hypothetical protein